MIYEEEEVKEFLRGFKIYNAGENWLLMERMLKNMLRLLKERLD